MSLKDYLTVCGFDVKIREHQLVVTRETNITVAELEFVLSGRNVSYWRVSGNIWLLEETN
jgi:hypothetical protein